MCAEFNDCYVRITSNFLICLPFSLPLALLFTSSSANVCLFHSADGISGEQLSCLPSLALEVMLWLSVGVSVLEYECESVLNLNDS